MFGLELPRLLVILVIALVIFRTEQAAARQWPGGDSRLQGVTSDDGRRPVRDGSDLRVSLHNRLSLRTSN
jgi:hypothetical protein